MRVLINSDRLYASYLIGERLPASLERLCHDCAERGVAIVLPETAVLEFDRMQSKLLQQEEHKLRGAYETLERYGVRFDRIDPKDLVRPPDLVTMMGATGATVEVRSPTFEDFREAHRRACLHESPQPPDAKSDEMRDLVIWMVALREARAHGGALLLSGDEVHTHGRGDEEASLAGLMRAREVDEALEILNVETPSGQLARQLLTAIWQDLETAGIPVAGAVEVRGVEDAIFVQGERGLSEAWFIVKVAGRDGHRLTLRCHLQLDGQAVTHVDVADHAIDGTWQGSGVDLDVVRSAAFAVDDVDERINALREVLEEEDGPQNG